MLNKTKDDIIGSLLILVKLELFKTKWECGIPGKWMGGGMSWVEIFALRHPNSYANYVMLKMVTVAYAMYADSDISSSK